MEPQRGPSGADISGNPAPPADVTRLAARSFDPSSWNSWADISFTLPPFSSSVLPQFNKLEAR